MPLKQVTEWLASAAKVGGSRRPSSSSSANSRINLKLLVSAVCSTPNAESRRAGSARAAPPPQIARLGEQLKPAPVLGIETQLLTQPDCPGLPRGGAIAEVLFEGLIGLNQSRFLLLFNSASSGSSLGSRLIKQPAASGIAPFACVGGRVNCVCSSWGL